MLKNTRSTVLNFGGLSLFLLIAYLVGFGIPSKIMINFYGKYFSPMLFSIGAGLSIAGFIFWFGSVYLLRRNGLGTPHPFYCPPKRLVSEGTYKYSRHPIYLGFILLLAGKGMIDNNLFILFELVLIIPIILLIIKIEEAGLFIKFGEEYKNYGARTPMLFPFM